MSIEETARKFFDACETGKGWAGCKEFCHDGATFSAQTDVLANIDSLEDYADWMKGMLVMMPDGQYELKSFATDVNTRVVTAFGVFHATHTVDGYVPATGKKVAADYLYAMQFDGDKIGHLTKVWNDIHSFRQLGWA